MLNTLIEFTKSEDGAVTVDWVVLTAAIAGFGLAVLLVLRPKVEDKTVFIGSVLDSAGVDPTF
ncbi:MAG TPA: hypothetical protein ENK34_04360 [Rhodobacteraceae bacterium]|nr:hypothetical protein [Paracoccaceae bacterium]